MPSHPDLAAAELQLLNALERERAFARKLTPDALAALDIEYLLIDSPPSLNVVSINILVAADYLIIPIEPHPLSVMVLPKLFEMVGRVQRLNPKLQIVGFLPTKVHATSRLAADMIDDLRTGFPELLILPSIPLSVRGAEAVAAYTEHPCLQSHFPDRGSIPAGRTEGREGDPAMNSRPKRFAVVADLLKDTLARGGRRGADERQADPPRPDRAGPRSAAQTFPQESLEELAASLKSAASCNPSPSGTTARTDRYVIIHGERRWRAAGSRGLETMPAIV